MYLLLKHKLWSCLVLLLLISNLGFSQTEDTKSDMSFDFGFTRGRNINIWPLLKKYKDREKKELQILYPIFSKTTNYTLHTKHTQIVPFLLSDSNALGRDIRFVSFYYPSLFRYQKSETSKSYKFLELAPSISCLGISKDVNGISLENNILFFLIYKHDTIENSTRLIGFPLYWYRATKQDTSNIFFPLFFKKTSYDKRHINIGILYNYKKEYNATHNRLFPIWWSSNKYNSHDTIKHRVIFPIYWSTTQNDVNNKTIFPLLYYRKNIDYFRFTVLPLFSMGHSTDKSEHYFDLCGIYWQKKTKDNNRTVVFPIWWQTDRITYTGDTVRHRTLFPIYWSTKDKQTNNTILFPFIYKLKNKDEHSFTFFPLFSKGESNNQLKKHLVITPLFWKLKSAEGESTTLFPFWWSQTDYVGVDTVISKSFFPLYWYDKNKAGTKLTLLPFVFRNNNNNFKSFTFLPFYTSWKSKLNDSSYKAFIPLYVHFKNAKSDKKYIFPCINIIREYTANDTIKQCIIFPFYWSNRSKTYNKKTLFPIVFSQDDEYKKSLTLFSIFSFGSTKDSSRHYVDIAGLYWHTSTNYFKRNILFPIWWSKNQYSKTDTTRFRTVFPIYWSIRNKEKKNTIIFPLVYRFKNQNRTATMLFPLYCRWKSNLNDTLFKTFFPIYWHIKDPRIRQTIVFPIFRKSIVYSKDDTIRRITIFPLYWSKHTKDLNQKFVLPFVYSVKNKDCKSFSFLPFYSKSQTSDSSFRSLNISPLYWHIQNPLLSLSTVFPLWWNIDSYIKNDTIKTRLLFPVYLSVKSKGKSNVLLFPIMYSVNNSNIHSTTILPFISKGMSKDSSMKYTYIFPFYLHRQTKQSLSTTLFPILFINKKYRNGDTIKNRTIFPIYFSHKTNTSNNKVLFPFVYSLKNKKAQSLTILPFFSKGQSTDSTKNYFDIFPFWWSKNEYFENDTNKRRAFLPFYWSMKNKSEHYLYIFPTIFHANNYLSKTTIVFPLFTISKSKLSEKKSYSILMFYWHLKDKYFKSDNLYPIFRTRTEYSYNDTLTKTHLFPIYWSKKSSTINNKVIFPIVYSFKNNFRSSFTFFPLFSFGKSKNKDSRYVLVTPIAGYFKSSNTMHSYIFPLYNYKSEDDKSQTSIFFFLFRKKTALNYSKTSILWPLCDREKTKTEKSFRIAPFVWYSKTDTSRMISFQPFQYSFKSNSRKTFILFWILYRYDNVFNKSISHSVLWKVFNSVHDANGEFENRFLYLLYANVKKNGKREKSLLPFYHSVENANGDKTVSIFFGFYNYFKQYKPEFNEFYEEERVFWLMRLRSNYEKLKQLGKVKDFKRR